MRLWTAAAAGLALWALQPASAQKPFPLEALRIEGNLNIPAERIAAASGLAIGTPMTKADFDAARERLLATGAFQSVGYEFKPSAAGTGYEGVFRVVEIEELFPYRFEDLPGSGDALRAALRKREPVFGDRIPATPEVLVRYCQAIEQVVGGGVKIVGRLNTDRPGQLTIVFRPPGVRPNVAEIRFTGNQALPATALTSALSQVAIGTPYSETNLRLLLDTSVRPLYDARGRIRATFPTISSEPSKKEGVDGVVVTVEVNEGSSYSLGHVQYAGVAAADLPELQKTANLQPADVANFDDINAGLERIYKRYRSRGYLRVAGHAGREIHDQEHTVDVTLSIDPGPQFVMGRLEIAGLDLTSEPAIRKAWALKPGAAFQDGYPEAFLDDLRGQGVFDNLGKTRAETHADDREHTVNVTLYFSGEAPPDRGKPRQN